MVFEAEFQYADTIFEKLRHKRNLKLQSLEQRRKAETDSELRCVPLGKGLVHCQQQQQNVEDAVKKMQKPLACSIDDESDAKRTRHTWGPNGQLYRE